MEEIKEYLNTNNFYKYCLTLGVVSFVYPFYFISLQLSDAQNKVFEIKKDKSVFFIETKHLQQDVEVLKKEAETANKSQYPELKTRNNLIESKLRELEIKKTKNDVSQEEIEFNIDKISRQMKSFWITFIGSIFLTITGYRGWRRNQKIIDSQLDKIIKK